MYIMDHLPETRGTCARIRQLSNGLGWKIKDSAFKPCLHDNQKSCWNSKGILQQITHWKLLKRSRGASSHSCREFEEHADGAVIFGGRESHSTRLKLSLKLGKSG